MKRRYLQFCVALCLWGLTAWSATAQTTIQGTLTLNGNASIDWDQDGDLDHAVSFVEGDLSVWDTAAQAATLSGTPIFSYFCDTLCDFCNFELYEENGVAKSAFFSVIPLFGLTPPPLNYCYSALSPVVGFHVGIGGQVCGMATDPLPIISAARQDWLDGLRPFPGSNEDFVQYTGVNGSATCYPRIKDANAGDFLVVGFDSPNGNYDFTRPILLAQPFVTGGSIAQPIGFPEVWVNPSPFSAFPVTILFDGGGGGPFDDGLLPPGGTTLSFLIPMSLSGHSVMLQTLSWAPSLMTGNGLFTASDAHEIRIL